MENVIWTFLISRREREKKNAEIILSPPRIFLIPCGMPRFLAAVCHSGIFQAVWFIRRRIWESGCKLNMAHFAHIFLSAIFLICYFIERAHLLILNSLFNDWRNVLDLVFKRCYNYYLIGNLRKKNRNLFSSHFIFWFYFEMLLKR